jgi:hypothetical protein
VQGFIDLLKAPAKSNNFFSIGTDASNHKNRKMILMLAARNFDPRSGVKNRLLDFTEQADETYFDQVFTSYTQVRYKKTILFR